MNKKNLFLWSLYDFANSVVYINFLLYFAEWLVIDGGLSDFWYNAIFAIASIALLLTGPSLAALTDKHGGRKYFLNVSTLGTFLSYGLAAILATLGSANIFLVALLFLIGQYFYQLSFVFYNPMLEDIADLEHRGRASGIGQFSNNLGQVFGLLMTLPLSASRTAPLIPAVGVFFILALPMMIYFKESKIKEKVSFAKVKEESKIFTRKFITFFTMSVATPMLAAYFFFNDALVTLSNNYPIYMERVFAVPDDTKSLLLMLILTLAAIGGVVGGKIGDKWGNLKTLKIILVCWIITIPITALAPDLRTLAIITGIIGLLIGSVEAVSRAYLSSILTRENMGYGFSFYALTERVATFIGPLTWGGIIWYLGTGSLSYRIAAGTMTIFVIVGFIVLSKFGKNRKIQL